MGQYYIPTIFNKESNIAKAYTDFEEQGREFKPIDATPVAALLSHDFKVKCTSWDGTRTFMSSVGLKLMEHSYIGNVLCRAVEYLLANEYAGCPIVWGGDYGDEVFNPTEEANEDLYPEYKDKPVSAYLLGSPLTKKTFNALPSRRTYYRYHKYLLNHDTYEYVKLPKNNKDWQVHPLPLLTCNGNGRGGGDYRLDNELIGAWCGHHLSVTNELPLGFKELKVDFPLDD